MHAAGPRYTLEVLGECAVRALIIGVLACGLGACASGGAQVAPAAAPTGDWKIEQRPDRISGTAQATALLIARSSNARTARSRPALAQMASLQLMCFDKAPVVRLHFNYRIGANRSATIAYRFDEKPGRDANARILPDFQTIVIQEPDDVMRFADELRTANALFVRVSSLIVGQSTAEFRVLGGQVAIDAAYAACPLPAASKRASRLKPGQGSHLFAKNESRP